jgi:peptidoglycan/LPS O-acetylase OafA/YrhL
VPHWFRADINGMRAVAISVVVAFHAHVPGFEGGFIGVDVFFVISGYLITQNLLREAEATGKVRLRTFWAKRIRRLAPALTAMLLLTAAVLVVTASPLELRQLGKEAAAASLYVSNLLFAREATDYFAAGTTESPFLHTWSLSVEEQFYLVWPLLVGACAMLATRLHVPLRTLLGPLLGTIAASSLWLAWMLADERSAFGFYSLPPRAWELAVGGLLACFGAQVLPRWQRRRSLASLLGLLLLGYGTMAIDGRSSFPILLVPVVAAALIIFGGEHGRREGRDLAGGVLSTRPLGAVGAISYSWYLWHWPAMIVAVMLTNEDSVAVRLAAGLISVPIAVVSQRLVEDGLRFSPIFASSNRRTYVLGAAAALNVLVVAVGLWKVGEAKLRVAPYAEMQAIKDTLPDLDCGGTWGTVGGLRYCSQGDRTSDRTVMLIGDSHAGHWEDAFGAAAGEAGLRLVVRWKPACPAIDVQIPKLGDKDDVGCQRYRKDTSALVRDLRPRLIVLSNSNGYLDRIAVGGNHIPKPQQAEVWGDALAEALRSMPNSKLGVVQDNPRLDYDPVVCAGRLGFTVERCTPSRDEAMQGIASLREEQAVVLEANPQVATFDFIDDLCEDTTCRIVAGGTYTFADNSHLSRAWTLQQVPEVRLFLEEALGA